jgi:hypothetical protein
LSAIAGSHKRKATLSVGSKKRVRLNLGRDVSVCGI